MNYQHHGNKTKYPGAEDIGSGDATLTLTAFPLEECQEVSDDIQVIIDQCTGTDDLSINFDLVIIPNPYKGEFTVRVNNNYYREVILTISSTEGRIAGSWLLSGENHFSSKLDLTKHGKDTYFVTVKCGKVVKAEKIIVR